ncbi:hypothetical protein AMS68_006025 [Peltaster fructicola]|uniref:Hemimethylated DNA-binding domain-containing protein n=1 Tax=Peltaster fructicola TaxID=286661 RepID=A0A6H0Y0Y9_9PEZI|nr:hypothetical protein AMS68_006025 [Peltaster fructicola]
MGWRYWHPEHDISKRIAQPPTQTRWRHLFDLRRKRDEAALATFNAMLLTQQHRQTRIEELTELRYDIKDLMLKLERDTPDHADDVLARRYYARIVRSKIHREMAIKQWDKLSDSRMVALDAALGAYDLFALSGEPADLDDLDSELDRHATAVRQSTPNFDRMSTRQKAIEIATYLRSENLLGNDQLGGYHALRNNYITLALMRTPHRSLPLQSAAIYCGVARRLGVDARPSNFPHHVYVVVQPPRHEDLEGRHKSPDLSEIAHDYMFMDPWRTNLEIDRAQLIATLNQMGTTPAHYTAYLSPATTADTVLRAGRNIVTSVTELRNLPRVAAERRNGNNVDIECAWYSMLWATMIIAYGNRDITLQRQRSCLPYLMEHYQVHFPEDLGLLERYIAPMFVGTEDHETLLHVIDAARRDDNNMKPPSPRSSANAHVTYKVGHHFEHKRYHYKGVIVGWTARCEAREQWIAQMRVNELPRGREQPFYHVLADDKSVRYVAQENIVLLSAVPETKLMEEAGRYFKRWDSEHALFVSNIKDEYPDD